MGSQHPGSRWHSTFEVRHSHWAVSHIAFTLRTVPAGRGRWKVRSSPSERKLVGRSIRQAIQDSTIPVPRCGFSRARGIGTESSNGSFAILFTAIASSLGKRQRMLFQPNPSTTGTPPHGTARRSRLPCGVLDCLPQPREARTSHRREDSGRQATGAPSATVPTWEQPA